MTTTLRPDGPERHDDAGGRTRRFLVRDNNRPVGSLRLTTARIGGFVSGRIQELTVDGPDRRRGRATVAVLAAEEVLRDWGCAEVEAAVPAEAEAAHHLALALGYRPRNHHLRKDLGTPPPLGEEYEVRAMDAAAYEVWRAGRDASYARSWRDRGLTAEAAATKARADHLRLLPQGPDTPRTVLRVLAHRGADVGTLWVSLRAAGREDGFVYLVEVHAGRRGEGHGRALMEAAERVCLAEGVRGLALNVFAGNTPAERLYHALDYRPVTHYLVKPLPGARPPH